MSKVKLIQTAPNGDVTTTTRDNNVITKIEVATKEVAEVAAKKVTAKMLKQQMRSEKREKRAELKKMKEEALGIKKAYSAKLQELHEEFSKEKQVTNSESLIARLTARKNKITRLQNKQTKDVELLLTKFEVTWEG